MKVRFKSLKPSVVVAQNDGSLGVDNIKNILTVVVTFFLDVIDVVKTRNYVRLLEIVWNLVRFGNILDVAKQAWEESKELSLEESKAIVGHLKEVFDLENDSVEERIEAAIDVIPRIYELALKVVGVGSEAVDIWKELKAIFSVEGEIAQAA